MKRVYLIILLFLFYGSEVYSQNMNIKITVHGLENSSMILANYYGDKQYVKDTFQFDRNGIVVLKADTILPGGVYLAVFPALDNRYFEFIAGEPSFTLSTDYTDLTGHMKTSGSIENDLFYKDISFLADKKKTADSLQAIYKAEKDAAKKSATMKQLTQIDKEVKDHRNEIITKQPDLFYAKLLKSMTDITVPDAPKDANGKVIDEAFQWRFYKAHYWDNVDLKDERLLRCPVLHNKLKTFMNQTSVQHPDSIIASSEDVLSKTDKKNELYRYIVTYIFNEMANSTVMGFDAAYVYLGKKYFCKESMTPWIESEKRFKICDRVTRLEPVLIGKKAQRLSLQTVDGEYQSLQGVNSKYTILSFWDTDCGHCKKEMPALAKAYNNLKRSGFNVEGYSVMVGERSSKSEWKNLIQKYNLNWINVADLDRESNFRYEWDIQSTPQIYVLNEDKKIVARRIEAEQVEEYIRSLENPSLKTKPLITATSNNSGGENVESTSFSNSQEKPKQPPVVTIKNVTFSDNDKNSVLSGNEKATINFALSNSGKGKATGLKVKATETTGQKGLFIEQLNSVGSIEPGSSKELSIPISATKSLGTGKAIFKIIAEEGNGFDSDPVEIEVKTREFLAPKMVIADYAFSTESGGPAKLGLPINLRVIAQNLGQGTAKNVSVNFSIPNNIFASDLSSFSLGELKSGETRVINFEFFGNKQYSSPVIPVTANVLEADGYGEDKVMEVKLEQILSSTPKIEIAGKAVDQSGLVQIASLSSEVDKNIPVNIGSNEHRYALIIGNEDYTKYQTSLGSEVNVEFAVTDARIFAAYCEKTLGIQKQNIMLLENAIGSKMKQKIEEISKLILYEEGAAEVFFYYAGHGFPDEVTKEGYLMPVDISGSNVTDGIKLSDLYQKLTANPVKRVSVFLDACFSGGGRDAGLLAARSVKVKPKANAVTGNLLVLSASTGEQSSLPFKEKQHGMFTYFLLKKLQETKGDVLYKDLFAYVKQQVELNSIKVNGKDQNPQLNYSSAIENLWGSWKVK